MRVSAIIWIVLGLGCGLVTLGVLGGGGYYSYELHAKVKDEEKKLEANKQEIEQLEKKAAINHAKIVETKQRMHEIEVDVQNAERSRLIAFIITGTFLIPGVLALAFFGMAATVMMKKKKKNAEEEEEEDGETEEAEAEEAAEEPPPKKKAKAKPAADDED